MEELSLPEDFRDFLQFLNEAKVEYLVVGGWAVTIHGVPRYTKDLDVWIGMTAENAKRIVAALHRFGFTHGEAGESLFVEPGNIVRMGFPPMRIEIMNQIDGVMFEDCFERRTMRQASGLDLPVISLDDLLANKRASGRPQDLADVDKLTA